MILLPGNGGSANIWKQIKRICRVLRERVITAIILLLVLAVLTTQLSAFLFTHFITLVVVLAAHEWARFIGIEKPAVRGIYLGSVVVLLVGLYFLFAINPATHELDPLRVNSVLALGLVFWIAVIAMLPGYPANAVRWNDQSKVALMGLLVLLPTWTGFVQLKYLDPSGKLVFLLVLLVSAADIGAYFTGKAFGVKKLAPALSPKKTHAGFWGGLVSASLVALVAILISHFFYHALTQLQMLLLMLAAMLTIIFSVAGDLFESMLKRSRQLKDSGSLLPGHGGIMDRVDSLTAAVPVYVLALSALGT
jgi:phosphatidate cytidylyltransferase